MEKNKNDACSGEPMNGIWTLKKASLFNDHNQNHSYHLLSGREEAYGKGGRVDLRQLAL